LNVYIDADVDGTAMSGSRSTEKIQVILAVDQGEHMAVLGAQAGQDHRLGLAGHRSEHHDVIKAQLHQQLCFSKRAAGQAMHMGRSFEKELTKNLWAGEFWSEEPQGDCVALDRLKQGLQICLNGIKIHDHGRQLPVVEECAPVSPAVGCSHELP
jgi:hypothetical protein